MRHIAGIASLTIVLVGGLAAQPASAQLRFAPQLAWGEDHDLAIGGRLLLNLSRVVGSTADEGLTSMVDLVLPFDWFLDCSDCSYFEVTPGVVVPLTVSDAGVYFGGGINIARFSLDAPIDDPSDTKLGLGLMAGVLVPIKSLATFAEVRFTVGGAEQAVLTLGVIFGGNEG